MLFCNNTIGTVIAMVTVIVIVTAIAIGCNIFAVRHCTVQGAQQHG